MSTHVVEQAPRRFLLGQHETRSVLGRRESGEVGVLLTCVVVGVAASLLSGGEPAGFVALVLLVGVGISAVYLPFRGRTLYRWLPVQARYVMARATKSHVYRSGAREAGFQFDNGRPAEIAAPPGIGRLHWLSAAYREATLAVVVQPDGSVVTCLEVEGPGVGLADTLEQEMAAARWGTLLRDVANSDGLVQRLSLLERSVPTDNEAHQRYVDRFGWVPAPQPLVDSYDDLHARIGAVSEQHRNYVVLSIPPSRALRLAVRTAGGGDLGLAAVASRETEAFASRLDEAGIRVLRPLSTERVSALIASCYGPWRSPDDLAGIFPSHAWPRGLHAEATHVEADGWIHATAWVKSWPLVPVTVDFLAPLLVQTPGIVRTVAVTMQLVPSDIAMSRVLSDMTTDQAHVSAAAKAGRTADPRDGRQLSQAEQRADDVTRGAAGVRLVGYITVSAPDEPALETAKRQMRSAAARSWLALEWCDREHDTAFVNTLPLARGLR